MNDSVSRSLDSLPFPFSLMDIFVFIPHISFFFLIEAGDELRLIIWPQFVFMWVFVRSFVCVCFMLVYFFSSNAVFLIHQFSLWLVMIKLLSEAKSNVQTWILSLNFHPQ